MLQLSVRNLILNPRVNKLFLLVQHPYFEEKPCSTINLFNGTMGHHTYPYFVQRDGWWIQIEMFIVHQLTWQDGPQLLKLSCILVAINMEGLPWCLKQKGSSCSTGDPGSISGLGRCLGEGNGYPLQYSCWRIPWTEESGGLVYGIAKSQTWLSN